MGRGLARRSCYTLLMLSAGVTAAGCGGSSELTAPDDGPRVPTTVPSHNYTYAARRSPFRSRAPVRVAKPSRARPTISTCTEPA
jgi:hypothetical protein